MMKTFLTLHLPLVIALVMSTGVTQAQTGATLTFGVNSIDYTALEVEDRREFPEMMLASFWLDLNVPMTLNDGRTTLVHSLYHLHLDKDFRNWIYAPDVESIDVHSATYRYTLQVHHQIGERWQARVQISPESKSNLEHRIQGSRFLASGSVAAVRGIGARTRVGLGVGYSRIFGAAMLHPVALVDWTDGRSLHLEGRLPELLRFHYAPAAFLEIGLEGRVSGDEFLGDAHVYGVDDARVRFTNVTFGPAVKVNVTSAISAEATGGTTLYRRMDVRDVDRNVQALNPAQTSFFRMGITLGLR